jgi:hypothetical protein
MADLVIFEIEQRSFETLTTASGWFSPRQTGSAKSTRGAVSVNNPLD